MIFKLILKFMNPLEWVRAYRFHRKTKAFDKSEFDLELYFYSKVLKNDMLHYGYFDDPDVTPNNISLQQLEDAQVRYSRKIMEKIADREGTVLDVGCGMGGLSGLLLSENYNVEALTPNRNQKEYIKHKHPDLTLHHCKFEDLKTDKKYGTIINSESLQYIKLDQAFDLVDKLLVEGGRWIVVDYFQVEKKEDDRPPHLLEKFLAKVKERNWEITAEEDISRNALPTIRMGFMIAERFLLPVKHFAYEKLRFKRAWLYYLTKDIRAFIDEKAEKELATIDPERFMKERRYMFYVVTKAPGEPPGEA